jgi:chromosome segregation ATPase
MTDSPLRLMAEYLRAVAQNDYMIDSHYLPTGVRLNEIADEIERLQTQITDLNADANESNAECGELTARCTRFAHEIERLRAALENIKTVREKKNFPTITALAYCRDKAREALEAAPPAETKAE